MRSDAEKNGPVWAGKDDERVTRFGRFIRKIRIDELPQMWNVLKGDMSFVGPRPERPVFVEQLVSAIPYYSLRHNVKPGITGWAQICYPYGASVEDALHKLEYDLYYIKYISLQFDFWVIFQTIKTVVLRKGAR
jgi:lipopolysaccharide/colanic/teichoic acid biosynthesis glycosyltransferase